MLKMKTELQKYLTYSYLVPKLLCLLTKLLQLTHSGSVQASPVHTSESDVSMIACAQMKPTGITIAPYCQNPVIQESTFIRNESIK